MPKTILDLMSPEDRDKAIERANKRFAATQSKKGISISPSVYAVAEFGYYYGWDAVLAVRRGYTVEPITKIKEVFSLEEMNVLLEGARKVWYSKLVETGGINTATKSFSGASTSYKEA